MAGEGGGGLRGFWWGLGTLELEGRRAVALKGFTGDIAAKMQREKHGLSPLYAHSEPTSQH